METINCRATQAPAASFYMGALEKLQETGIPFLVGGALAYSHYTNIPRDTKDMDVFVKPSDCPRVLDAFGAAGYRTEITFPHWLAKVWRDDYFVDVIFSSGNGVARVDDLWFEHAPKANLPRVDYASDAGRGVDLVQGGSSRSGERLTAPTLIHLLRETGPSLDWPRLLMRFADYWRVLFSHLILFGFVYPDKRESVPAWVMDELVRRLGASRTHSDNDVCYGTLLSREQYLYDLERLRYR